MTATEIHDVASGRRVGINGGAHEIVSEIDGSRSVGQIAGEISHRFGIGEDLALADTTALIRTMRKAGLLRVSNSSSDRLLGMFIAVSSLDFSPVKDWLLEHKRVDVRGGSFLAIMAQVSRAMFLGFSWLAVYLTVLSGSLMLVLVGSPLYALAVPLGTYTTIVLGLALHESAHLYVLRRVTGNRSIGYLMLSRADARIVRPRVPDDVELAVAAAGPLVPTLCGAAFYAANALHPTLYLPLVALPFVLHALNLLPFAPDGRKLLMYANGSDHPVRSKENETVFKQIAKSLVIATIFSIILMMTGAVGVTVYALANTVSVDLGSVYGIEVGGDGSFSITMGAGFFLTLMVLTGLLTLLISIGPMKAARR